MRKVLTLTDLLIPRAFLYFGGGGKPAPAPTPQAAAPAAAPLRPPSQTDMEATVMNPEARRKAAMTGRAGNIFGSAGTFDPQGQQAGLGVGSSLLGTGR